MTMKWRQRIGFLNSFEIFRRKIGTLSCNAEPLPLLTCSTNRNETLNVLIVQTVHGRLSILCGIVQNTFFAEALLSTRFEQSVRLLSGLGNADGGGTFSWRKRRINMNLNSGDRRALWTTCFQTRLRTCSRCTQKTLGPRPLPLATACGNFLL